MKSAARALRTAVLLLAGASVLGGCGFRLPSFGSIGSGLGRTQPVETAAVPAPDTPLTLPARQVQVESALRGIIVRVTAIAPTQGWYDAALVPVDTASPDMLAFELHATAPEDTQSIGAERSRVLLVAAFLSNAELRGIRQIFVNGTALPFTPR